MMKYLMLILIILGIGCQKEKESVLGHWHIHNSLEFHDTYFTTLDVNDSTAIINKVFNGEELSSSVDGNKFIINTELAEKDHHYFFSKNDTLFLSRNIEGRRESMDIGTRWTGCKFEDDYFYESSLKIDLPVMKHIGEGHPGSRSTHFDILTGKLDSQFLELPILGLNEDVVPSKDSIYFGTSYRIFDINELEVFNQKTEIKIPEMHRGKIKVMIYADKNTPLFKIRELINTQKSVRNYPIFFVGKNKEDIKSQTELRFFPIDSIPHSQKNITLDAFIN